MLLFGVAYFFKYSIEMGWLTPGVQSFLGFILGLTLLLLGFRTLGSYKAFSQVLSGSCLIFYFREWLRLLWSSMLGGWFVFAVLFYRGIYGFPETEIYFDKWAIQSGIFFSWLVFWIIPLQMKPALKKKSAEFHWQRYF